MTSSPSSCYAGWCRVASGLRLVVEASAKRTAGECGEAAIRTARHGAEVASSLRTASASASALYGDPVLYRAAESAVWTAWREAAERAEAGTTAATKPPSWADWPTTRESSAPNVALRPSYENDNVPETPIESFDGTVQVDASDQSQNVSDENDGAASAAAPAPTIAVENEIRTSGTIHREHTRDNPVGDEGEDEIERLKEGRAVPASRVGRAMGFASLGVGLAVGTVAEGASRLLRLGGSGGDDSGRNLAVNDANADRLAASLCRMRGAALKMGQMLSIQDESLLPPALTKALHQVRQGAEAMPNYQLVRQMEEQLGKDWRHRFDSFDETPFAAASIGQVHRAQIQRSNGNDEGSRLLDVVVKVQYPGVARSIESDLRNLAMLVTWTGLAPRGLFLENVIRVGQQELKVECDYRREMDNQLKLKRLVESDTVLRENRFVVPGVIPELTASELITTEFCPGGTIDKVSHLDQDERNRIARTVLYLTMKELFEWRVMQTDPNWGNFLYDVGTRTTSLIDFGATREYSKEFVDGYLRIVWAAANRDEETLMAQSHRMGFLTGRENDAMLRAHKMSGFTVGEPFQENEAPFDFRGSNISARMGEHTAVFLRHRLTPPPAEVYTLHRKLAGAYMLCIKLDAVIHCRDMLHDIVRDHAFEDDMDPPPLN